MILTRRLFVLVLLAWLLWRDYQQGRQIVNVAGSVIDLAGAVSATLELYKMQDDRLNQLEKGRGRVENVPLKRTPMPERKCL